MFSAESLRKSIPDLRMADHLAQFFGTLGASSRVRIVGLLVETTKTGAEFAERGLRVGEIAEVVDMSPSAVSHHLRTLRQIRLVHAHKIGREVYYFLDDDCIATIYEIGRKHLESRL